MIDNNEDPKNKQQHQQKKTTFEYSDGDKTANEEKKKDEGEEGINNNDNNNNDDDDNNSIHRHTEDMLEINTLLAIAKEEEEEKEKNDGENKNQNDDEDDDDDDDDDDEEDERSLRITFNEASLSRNSNQTKKSDGGIKPMLLELSYDNSSEGSYFGIDDDDGDDDGDVVRMADIKKLAEEEIRKMIDDDDIDPYDNNLFSSSVSMDGTSSLVSYDDNGHRDEKCELPHFLYEQPKPLPKTPWERFMYHFKSCSEGSDRYRNIAAKKVVRISMMAARSPRIAISTVVSITFCMLIGGILKRPGMENVDLDFNSLFTPLNSQTYMLRDWYIEAFDNDDPTNDPTINRMVTIPDNVISSDNHDNNRRLLENNNKGNKKNNAQRISSPPPWQSSFAADHNFPTSARLSSSSFINSSRNLQQTKSLESNNNNKNKNMNVTMEFSITDAKLGVIVIIHADGDNVLNIEAVNALNEVVTRIKNISPGYNTLCGGELYKPGPLQCFMGGIFLLWEYESVLFESDTHDATKPTNDQELLQLINNAPQELDVLTMIGNAKFAYDNDDNDQRSIVAAESLLMAFNVEYNILDSAVLKLFELQIDSEFRIIQQEWENNDDIIFTLEGISNFSTVRAIQNSLLADVPLLIAVFFIMFTFTALVFFKCDKVRSRSLLGLGGVTTIMCSILTGTGLMFLIGVPLTPMTIIIPFFMFGVGLDDTFVIVGEYNRLHRESDILVRLHHTMEEVAVSVITTTLTTTLSFCFGMTCSIPAIKGVCIWAAPMVMIDFFYQITMFVALVSLDEHRIEENRSSYIVCCILGRTEITRGTIRKTIMVEPARNKPTDVPAAERVMKSYADFLMKPLARKLVLLIFGSLFLFSFYRASLMTEEFSPTSIIPPASPVYTFFGAIGSYHKRYIQPKMVFRFVDQGDSNMQDQMKDFIEDIIDVPGFGEDPPFSCWLTSYRLALDTYPIQRASLDSLGLYQQLDLVQTKYPDEYSTLDSALLNPNTVRNKEGEFLVSQCGIYINDVDMDDSKDQMKLMNNIHEAEANHIMNKGRPVKDYPFFTLESTWYPIWELLNTVKTELAITVITSVLAVGIVGFFIIPHWSGMLFILPTIVVLLTDLIGCIQVLGIRIDPISYVALVVAIGLMVDYIIHILIRYYESVMVEPIDKVKDTLQTMGSSVLVGGLSTFLGFCPLLFSQSEICLVIARTIISMVAISMAHGLVLLPVVLSYIGPSDTFIASKGRAQC